MNDIIDNNDNIWPIQFEKKIWFKYQFLHYYTVQSLVKNSLLKIKREITLEL